MPFGGARIGHISAAGPSLNASAENAAGTGAALNAMGSTSSIVGGATAWYDPSVAASITSSSGAVSQLNDLSGNGHHLVQATAGKKPITATRTINGLNALDYVAASTQFLKLVFSYSYPLTVQAVVKYDLTGQSNSQWFGNTPDNLTQSPTVYQGAGNWDYYDGTEQQSSIPVDTSPHQVTVVFNGASSEMWLDGVSIKTGNPGTNVPTGVILGGDGPSAALSPFDGLIAEVIVYASALSTPNRQANESYLKAKWATPDSVVAANDTYVRANNADMTVSAPFSYIKLLSTPNDVTSELLSNAAHTTDTAGNASCYRAESDMSGNDHSVHIRLSTAVWNTTSDNVGVCARSGPGADHSFYQFSVVRIAGPTYVPYLYRFNAGVFVSILTGAPGANLASAPVAGDILTITVLGTTVIGKINDVTVVTATDANITGGLLGGWYMARGDATANFAIDRLWLNRHPFNPDDNFNRADNGDVTINAPVVYTKYNTVAPDNIIAGILSNQARDPDHGGFTTAYSANIDMAASDHIVYIKLGTQVWSATNDFIGVMLRANSPQTSGDRSGYGFVVWRDAGPVYSLRRIRWDAGTIVAINTTGSTLASAPIAGDYLAASISGTTLTMWYSSQGAPFTSVATNTSATLTTGLRGGWTIQQAGAGSDLRIDEFWLNRSPF